MQRVQNITTLPSACLFTLVTVTLVWLDAGNGGYFPPAWGWAAMTFAWVAAVALLLRTEISLSRLGLLVVSGLALFTGWSAITLAWTADSTVGVQNVERDLVYLCAAIVTLALADRMATMALRNAVLVSSVIVCLYSIATRLFPDQLGLHNDPLSPGRLYNPLGYWNAQGALAALAIILTAGLAAGRGRPVVRALAAGVIPFLALDCYYTLSRGAVIAVVVGFAVWIVADPSRVRSSVWLLILAPWPAIAVIHAHSITQLSGKALSLDSASAGHHLALTTLGIALVGAIVVGVAATFEHRIAAPPSVTVAYVACWCAVVAIAATVAFARFGSPVDMARSARSAFTEPPTSRVQPNRVLSLSLNGRASIWTVAWDDAKAHPIVGAGIGSFEQSWDLRRTVPGDIRYAHSLYLETLAETGIVGLALLAAAMIAPLAGVFRGRMDPLVPPLLGAYAAFLVHAGTDWDWQVPALALSALWCGMGVITAGEREPVLTLSQAPVVRWTAVAFAVALGTIAALGLAGNRDLELSQSAAARGDYAAAISAAHSATGWQPWSYLPWMDIGDARRSEGNDRAARAAYRTAARRDPGRWDPWFSLVQVDTGASRSRALRQASRRNPLSPEVAIYCRNHQVRGCR